MELLDLMIDLLKLFPFYCPKICDAVAVAKILNATLILPYLDVNPVWQDSRSGMPILFHSPFSNIKFFIT